MAAFPGDRGREIDDDALSGKGQAYGMESGAHPLAAFGHRFVGQAHHMELHMARDELRLNVDGDRLDPLKCHSLHPRRHDPAPRPMNLTL
jgi:hypothetical protein